MMLGVIERIIGLNQKGEAGGHGIAWLASCRPPPLGGRVDAVISRVVAVLSTLARNPEHVNQRAAMAMPIS